jgi:hypothetical protein
MNTALRICRGVGFILMGVGEILNAVFICRRKKGSKVFFSEEKKQKTFANSMWVPPDKTAKHSQSLLVLFFRKELLPSLSTPCAPPASA